MPTKKTPSFSPLCASTPLLLARPHQGVLDTLKLFNFKRLDLSPI
jgi:hypothetical protein